MCLTTGMTSHLKSDGIGDAAVSPLPPTTKRSPSPGGGGTLDPAAWRSDAASPPHLPIDGELRIRGNLFASPAAVVSTSPLSMGTLSHLHDTTGRSFASPIAGADASVRTESLSPGVTAAASLFASPSVDGGQLSEFKIRHRLFAAPLSSSLTTLQALRHSMLPSPTSSTSCSSSRAHSATPMSARSVLAHVPRAAGHGSGTVSGSVTGGYGDASGNSGEGGGGAGNAVADVFPNTLLPPLNYGRAGGGGATARPATAPTWDGSPSPFRSPSTTVMEFTASVDGGGGDSAGRPGFADGVTGSRPLSAPGSGGPTVAWGSTSGTIGSGVGTPGPSGLYSDDGGVSEVSFRNLHDAKAVAAREAWRLDAVSPIGVTPSPVVAGPMAGDGFVAFAGSARPGSGLPGRGSGGGAVGGTSAAWAGSIDGIGNTGSDGSGPLTALRPGSGGGRQGGSGIVGGRPGSGLRGGPLQSPRHRLAQLPSHSSNQASEQHGGAGSAVAAADGLMAFAGDGPDRAVLRASPLGASCAPERRPSW